MKKERTPDFPISFGVRQLISGWWFFSSLGQNA